MNTPIYHNDIEQGTDAWLAIRNGILTASEIKLIMTPTRKPANNDKSRAHIWEIAAQRISGHTEPRFITDDMIRGHNDEILARDLYSEKYAPVTECGFITRLIGGVTFGYSPDGLVGDDGLIEIKSRRQRYQVETIMSGQVPAEYMAQIQTGLMVTGRAWLDFISYSAGLPMFVSRVYPDFTYQAAITEAAIEFDEAVEAIIDTYNVEAEKYHKTERTNTELEII